MLTVHVVSHTHWDREWYQTAERFRQRLVALIDELLENPRADGGSFLLDGQTVVLEDYLDIQPERASELGAMLREQRLEAGPWYVLPDELIPGGEALVRNLLAGRRTLRALRADPPPVLYCPDSFGHPAALPDLARGFGCSAIVVWRGFGGSRWPDTDVFWWRAPSGERVLTYHLTRSGYELGANLAETTTGATERWKSVGADLRTRSRLGAALLLNGADHHARQQNVGAALKALQDVARPEAIRPGTLREFATDIEHRAATHDVPEVRGELRDSYGYTWTLPGTLATRAPLKRRYVRAERRLLRDVEPWAAFANFIGKRSRRSLTRAAWQPLLLCQPHDTLCGCSIDDVARATDIRLDSAASQAKGLRRDSIEDWLGHDAEQARVNQDRWRAEVLVRNRSPRRRSGVAIVELVSKIADIPVGPGSTHVQLSTQVMPKTPKLATPGPVQILHRQVGHELTESPRHYPDDDAVARLQAAVWVEDAPPYGIQPIPFVSGRAKSLKDVERVRAETGQMSNGHLVVKFAANGAVTIEDVAGTRAIRNVIEWESNRDRGDLYTPAIRESKLAARLLNTRLVLRGPLRAAVEQRWRLRDADNRVDLRARFILDADARFVRIRIIGQNVAKDHRLRVCVHTDVQSRSVVADAAFGPVRRRPVEVSEEDLRMEEPVPTAPLHRYVSLFGADRGATVIADGLTEYEADGDTIAVTLLRSVGELSKSDISERPGHAGWPAPTPEAQCIGPFEAELALLLHGPESAAVVDEIERAADDVLFPLTGETLRSALEAHAPLHGAALDGVGLAFSAAKESEDGEWLVLRCVNLLDQEASGHWTLGRDIREAHLARLDETPLTQLQHRGATIPFFAPPRGVTTILVR